MTHPPSDGSEQPAEGGAGGEGMPLNPSAADDFAVVREALEPLARFAGDPSKDASRFAGARYALAALSHIQARLARYETALGRIANGNVGTLDPAGDGGTYILTGNEWLEFRIIARNALTENPDA